MCHEHLFENTIESEVDKNIINIFGHCIFDELTLEDFERDSTLEDIKNITLKEGCRYSNYDIISHEVLAFIATSFKEDGILELIEMEKRAVIFPKQLKRIRSV